MTHTQTHKVKTIPTDAAGNKWGTNINLMEAHDRRWEERKRDSSSEDHECHHKYHRDQCNGISEWWTEQKSKQMHVFFGIFMHYSPDRDCWKWMRQIKLDWHKISHAEDHSEPRVRPVIITLTRQRSQQTLKETHRVLKKEPNTEAAAVISGPAGGKTAEVKRKPVSNFHEVISNPDKIKTDFIHKKIIHQHS